ncbi:hypothetical protein [Novosphingobium nitrogenifigens]|uniref:hypothetical protein n=1 Tax=Novosphingobium nitrogenifigens TaxID=378548 RepID=UPI00037D4CBA|nr:hypothetical protein [Novosphingobium nitrogenifigens]
MTIYGEADTIIKTWAKANVKTLFVEWAGQPARFAYLPGHRPLECFQISIEPPVSGHIAVNACSIDTDDGSEFEKRWEGPLDSLAAMLDDATALVRGWANRPV